MTTTPLPPAHRAEVGRLLERTVQAAPLLERARAELEDIAGSAPQEYAAYAAALEEVPRTGQKSEVTGTALVVAAGAVAAFAADLGLGTSAGTAVGGAAAVAVAGAAVTAVRATGGGRAASGPGEAARARERWLAAVERRGVRPFLERQQRASTPREAPAKTVPAPRRTDRSAAARARSLLDQSFGHLPDVEGPFTGRREQLRQISQWVQQARVSPETTPVVVLLHGQGGSGRSA
ncbi:MAG: hypothetical protein QOF84_4763, partial [Streptomyces sp.]|nr:hypothetical protein [Streptomyces sp.]